MNKKNALGLAASTEALTACSGVVHAGRVRISDAQNNYYRFRAEAEFLK